MKFCSALDRQSRRSAAPSSYNFNLIHLCCIDCSVLTPLSVPPSTKANIHHVCRLMIRTQPLLLQWVMVSDVVDND
eukprot:scaffold10462_cov111-Skeletonema_marinoi.AAC.7